MTTTSFKKSDCWKAALVAITFAVYFAIVEIAAGFTLAGFLGPNLWLIGTCIFWLLRFEIDISLFQTRRHRIVGLALVAVFGASVIAMTTLWPNRPTRSLGASVFLLILLVPVAEEMFFRGALLDWFQQIFRNRAVAVAAVSMVFGLVHLPQGLTVACVMTGLSLILASTASATGTILWSVAIHVGWNALSVIRELPSGNDRLFAAFAALSFMTVLSIIGMMPERRCAP